MSHCSSDNHHNEKQNACEDAKTCSMPEDFLALADEAWLEVLKEKLKENMREVCGKQLDELAKIVCEANGQKWDNRIQAKSHCEAYKQKIGNFFANWDK